MQWIVVPQDGMFTTQDSMNHKSKSHDHHLLLKEKEGNGSCDIVKKKEMPSIATTDVIHF
jgi:hypothetical protein